MNTAMIIAACVGCALLGVQAGYWARDVQLRIRKLYAMFKDRLETPAGVVRPERVRGVTRGQQAPIDLSTDDPGLVMRPTPEQAAMQRGDRQ